MKNIKELEFLQNQASDLAEENKLLKVKLEVLKIVKSEAINLLEKIMEEDATFWDSDLEEDVHVFIKRNR